MIRIITLVFRNMSAIIDFLGKFSALIKENFKDDKEKDVRKGGEKFVQWTTTIIVILALIDTTLGHRIEDFLSYIDKGRIIQARMDETGVDPNSCDIKDFTIDRLHTINDTYLERIIELRDIIVERDDKITLLIEKNLHEHEKQSSDKPPNESVKQTHDYMNIVPVL